MAAIDLAVQRATLAGTTPTFAAANTDGYTIAPQQGAALWVKNAAGAPITVTVVVPGNTPADIAQPDVTVSVPATTGERRINLDRPVLRDSDTGKVTVTFSSVTSVTVGYFG